VSLLRRLAILATVRRMGLALAVFTLSGCGMFGGAKSPDAVARETVRGAIWGVANAVELATNVCAKTWLKMDEESPEAKRLFTVCKTSWDQAEAALEAADRVVDLWDAATSGAKIACLGARALDALAGIMHVLNDFGVKMDAALKVTIDDGLALAKWLVRLAPGGSCPLPPVGAKEVTL
jgi:hypothetical protein